MGMAPFNASYIISKSEFVYLAGTAPDIQLTYPALYVWETHLSGVCTQPQDAESLADKKMASIIGETLVVEPVVDLLVKSVMSAGTLWSVKRRCSGNCSLLLRADALCMIIEDYPYIDETWKITPYQNMDALLSIFYDVDASEVVRVGKDGMNEVSEIMIGEPWIKDQFK